MFDLPASLSPTKTVTSFSEIVESEIERKFLIRIRVIIICFFLSCVDGALLQEFAVQRAIFAHHMT
jgi:hypothetical protein